MEENVQEQPVEAVTETPAATEKPVNPNMKWYVVHTYSGSEERAKLSLIENARMNKCSDKFGEIIVPKTMSETQNKAGKKKQVSKTSFPGYIIVQMMLDDLSKHVVKDTPKVTGFVGNQLNPRPISDIEVQRLTSPESIIQQKKVEMKVSFDKGDSVKVIDGPFTNFDGVVDDVRPDKAKVRVLVSIFGRETPVDLEYSQVQKN